jgi:DNA polymerase-3 subunit gamma/tau
MHRRVGLKVIYRAVDSGTDARQFARQVVDVLRGVMMAASGNVDLVEATPETRTWMKEQAGKMSPAVLVRAIRAFSLAAADTRSGWRPQLPLELAFIDSAMETPATGGPADVRPSSPSGAAPLSQVRSTPPSPVSSPSGPVSSPPKASSYTITPNPVSEAERPSAGGLTLDRIRESWSRVLGALRERDSRSYTLFANSQPDSLEGDSLGLVVDSDLVRQKCSRQETQLLLQGVLAEVLGQPLRVRFTVGRIRKASEGTANYPDGGMVDTASREFGAHVIDLP